MSTHDFEKLMDDLLNQFNQLIYFILISSVNGVVLHSRINEEEFNKASLCLNFSQFYDISKEITDQIGVQDPDFNLIHSDNYYILTIRILNQIITILSLDTIDINEIFHVINDHIVLSSEN